MYHVRFSCWHTAVILWECFLQRPNNNLTARLNVNTRKHCLMLSSVCSALSDSVQLLCGPLRLQPLPYSWPQVWLRVVWWCSRQLLVFRLLQWTCTADLPRPRHPLCECWPLTSSLSIIRFSKLKLKLTGAYTWIVHRKRYLMHPQFLWKWSFSFLQIEPLSGLLEGSTMVTISGSNLGQKAEDILHSVSVAGVPCTVIPSLYEVSSRYRQTAAGGWKVQKFRVFIFMFLSAFDEIICGLSRFLNTKVSFTFLSALLNIARVHGQRCFIENSYAKSNVCLPGLCAGPKPVEERRWTTCLLKWAEESLACPARHSATRYIRLDLIVVDQISLTRLWKMCCCNSKWRKKKKQHFNHRMTGHL